MTKLPGLNITLIVAFSIACSQASSKKSGSNSPASQLSSGDVLVNENGAVTADFDQTDTSGMAIIASADTDIKGSAVKIDAGSLSGTTAITLQQGANLAENDVAAALGLGDKNRITAAGSTVMVTASSEVEVRQPLHVTLPLPRKLDLQIPPLENLVIIYKGIMPTNAGFIVGVFSLASLTIDGDTVSFPTNLFGSYQAIFTTRVVANEQKMLSQIPLLSRTAEAARRLNNLLPTVTATLTTRGQPERAAEPGKDGHFLLQTLSETPSDSLSLAFSDGNGDALDVFFSDCPDWIECKVYDDFSSHPKVSVRLTPGPANNGAYVLIVTARDFFGAPLKSTIQINVAAPALYLPAVGLKFVDFPIAQDSVSCLKYSVSTVDKTGKVTRPSEKSVAFLSPGSGRFYANNTCSLNSAVDQISFGPDNGIVDLYYNSSVPQLTHLAVYAPEALKWVPAFLDQTIDPGPTAQIKFMTTQSSMAADECLMLSLYAADIVNNQRAVEADLAVTVSVAHGNFFIDPGCASAVAGNKISIAAGLASTVFYYKGTRSPGEAVTATAPANPTWKVATTFVEVTPAAISQISFIVAPVSLKVGECSMFMVGTNDLFTNPSPVLENAAIVLSANAPVENGGYFADATCTEPLIGGEIMIPSGEVAMKAYFKPLNQLTDPVVLTATTALNITNKAISTQDLPVAP